MCKIGDESWGIFWKKVERKYFKMKVKIWNVWSCVIEKKLFASGRTIWSWKFRKEVTFFNLEIGCRKINKIDGRV